MKGFQLIPKIIWQTYKDPYSELPDYIKDTTKTWIDLNPEYEYRYMDDSQAAEFVLQEFGKEWHEIFITAPLGVMRGDIWRYMVVYKYGGIYADLDCVCLKPIDSWINNDYSLIVCPENESDFCQWNFAAKPGSQIIKNVLDLIKEAFANPDYLNPNFVHAMTGPTIWTKGIYNALGFNKKYNLINDYKEYNLLPKSVELGFYCHGGENWRMFHHLVSQNIYGSQNWQHGYVQWIVERRNFSESMGVHE